ncbi:unnamed protein product, partial [Darwinula stevensoni]
GSTPSAGRPGRGPTRGRVRRRPAGPARHPRPTETSKPPPPPRPPREVAEREQRIRERRQAGRLQRRGQPASGPDGSPRVFPGPSASTGRKPAQTPASGAERRHQRTRSRKTREIPLPHGHVFPSAKREEMAHRLEGRSHNL